MKDHGIALTLQKCPHVKVCDGKRQKNSKNNGPKNGLNSKNAPRSKTVTIPLHLITVGLGMGAYTWVWPLVGLPTWVQRHKFAHPHPHPHPYLHSKPMVVMGVLVGCSFWKSNLKFKCVVWNVWQKISKWIATHNLLPQMNDSGSTSKKRESTVACRTVLSTGLLGTQKFGVFLNTFYLRTTWLELLHKLLVEKLHSKSLFQSDE